ncbi:proline racemase family protein [Streptomyces iranensis]|uniref:Proline racemase n=1 Tax=Streptomyces iranensis TaxID=576784 RepID=A0A060ZIW3_9ACTN|nr:proline racemase family protein [Streptomyces iranensis]MBP2063381.1 proline racemase [Streptomyces iranensis]CDR01628.1 proline racemase [Streptomyces iranensis]
MRFSRSLHVVDAHAEGESGKVVVGGLPPIHGETVFDKRLYFEERHDQLRKLLLQEPRGAVWHNANVVVPSNNPQADMGFIILESTEYPAMSGSNTMCVATVLLETGILPMAEPVTDLVLESPAGLIKVECHCANGKVERVKLVNQPAFVYHKTASLDVPGLGMLIVDVAYGGMTYVVVDAEAVGFKLDVSEEAALCEVGQRIKKAGAEQLEVVHPENPLIPGITQTLFAGPLHHGQDEYGNEIVHSRNAVIVSPGRVDRSPCGTGTSARVAVLHAHGQLKPGQLFRHESLIGSLFDARIEDTARVGPYEAVVPSISGRAWITSLNQLVLDPSDPFQSGFVVGRPWEPER